MTVAVRPRVSAIDSRFWEACDEGRLMIQRCGAPGCGSHVYYPRVCCPYCGGGTLVWEEACGQGELVSSTVIWRPNHESFRGEVPYQFACIRLQEGPLIYSRLRVDAPDVPAASGARVRVTFENNGGVTLPYFELT